MLYKTSGQWIQTFKDYNLLVEAGCRCLLKCLQSGWPYLCVFQFHPLWSVFPVVYSLILSAVVSSYVLCSSFSSHFLSSVECSHVMKVSVGDQGLSQLSCKLSRFSCLFPCHMGQIVPCPGFLHTVVISCLFLVVLLSLEWTRIIWLVSCLLSVSLYSS